MDTLEDEQANTFKQAFGINSDLEKIYKILSPAQQYAFTEYFLQEKTLKEIAEAHGVTTTRAGNLTKQVVKKIRKRGAMFFNMEKIFKKGAIYYVYDFANGKCGRKQRCCFILRG